MRYFAILAAVLVMLLAPASAKAADSIVLQHTGLRAGPGTQYPLLADMIRGQRIEVLGCIRGWRWCEVVAGGLHGFAVGERLGTNWYGRNVQVGYYGPRLGLPFVEFTEQPYWSKYYYDRDFYQTRYGHHEHGDYHDNLHCHDADHDGDCHPIVHEHRHHEGDHAEDHWHHSDGAYVIDNGQPQPQPQQDSHDNRWNGDVHPDNHWHTN